MNPDYIKWLKDEARYELNIEEFYNLIAQYTLNDPQTDLLMTLSEAGLED